MRSHHYHHDCFIIIMTVGDAKDAHPVRPDWRCRGCVVIIIMMTVGDAEDAR